ncbi:unnamed protein product [Bemisia tabaci]|uniref:Myotubularin phosphatase domain-containing protein n=1 Tax=Bemisia tabaci TaxID=7038 RepID=A0A9P0A0H2_BEMTA|nr:unnamed protein product [Bemisia tabaci]
MEEVCPFDIKKLLRYFAKNTYRARDATQMGQDVMQKCVDLIGRDYSYVIVNNHAGELSAHYPSQLIVIEYERQNESILNERMSRSTIYENVYDAAKLRDLFGKGRFARCRARFPCPVIFYKGKHICRSATLSRGPEIYGRSGLDYFFAAEEANDDDDDIIESNDVEVDAGEWQLLDKVRKQDIKLLKTLNIGTIIDLMVEKKKVKFGLNVTSSEKVDKEKRYCDFNIISLPYPGCEFFKEFRSKNYSAKGLVFDWTQTHVDADIDVPDDSTANNLKISWSDYKEWDLVQLTQNYLRLILRYVSDNNTGTLVHCISGWDRTPLYISLLRLSLWADGVIHQSLNAKQILYLTIAYDWFLFGHNLQDRLSKGEDIFFFCFYFLKYLQADEFSVLPRNKVKHGSVSRNDSDSQLESTVFDLDGSIHHGSNISLHSSWSSISSRSQDNPILLNAEDCTVRNGSGTATTGKWLNSLESQNSDSSSPSLSMLGNTPSTSTSNASSGSSNSAESNGGLVIVPSSPFRLSSSSLTSLQNYPIPVSYLNGNGSSHLPVNAIECSPACIPNPATKTPNPSLCNVPASSNMNSSSIGPVNNITYPNLFNASYSSLPSCELSQHVNGSSALTTNLRQPGSPRNDLPRRTSPVAVPAFNSNGRQRTESSGSLGVGSWQFISGTGSLRGSGSTNSTCGSQLSSNNSRSNLFEGITSESTSTIVEDDCFIYGSDIPTQRKERLKAVRVMFYHYHSKTIGYGCRDGTESSTLVGNIIGNFAEKVGIRNSQHSSV